jgi:hypothetical protein
MASIIKSRELSSGSFNEVRIVFALTSIDGNQLLETYTSYDGYYASKNIFLVPHISYDIFFVGHKDSRKNLQN